MHCLHTSPGCCDASWHITFMHDFTRHCLHMSLCLCCHAGHLYMMFSLDVFPPLVDCMHEVGTDWFMSTATIPRRVNNALWSNAPLMESRWLHKQSRVRLANKLHAESNTLASESRQFCTFVVMIHSAEQSSLDCVVSIMINATARLKLCTK